MCIKSFNSTTHWRIRKDGLFTGGTSGKQLVPIVSFWRGGMGFGGEMLLLWWTFEILNFLGVRNKKKQNELWMLILSTIQSSRNPIHSVYSTENRRFPRSIRTNMRYASSSVQVWNEVRTKTLNSYTILTETPLCHLDRPKKIPFSFLQKDMNRNLPSKWTASSSAS